MMLKRLSAKCRACPKVDTCDHKRMECYGYLPEPAVAPVVQPNVADLTAPLLVKRDYRDIKVSESMTITIDVEELKRKMEKDFYRSMLGPLV